ncbi:MAG: DUF308 domain-containing protein [Candidatus Limnocylindrales bacterium]
MAQLLGVVLTVTGVIDLVVTFVRGPNMNMSKRTGMISGIVLLVVGIALLIVAR